MAEEQVEEVVVQVSDLQTIRAAVHNLLNQNIAIDLQNQYRLLSGDATVSPLTTQAEDALRKVDAALSLARPDTELEKEDDDTE